MRVFAPQGSENKKRMLALIIVILGTIKRTISEKPCSCQADLCFKNKLCQDFENE